MVRLIKSSHVGHEGQMFNLPALDSEAEHVHGHWNLDSMVVMTIREADTLLLLRIACFVIRPKGGNYFRRSVSASKFLQGLNMMIFATR